MSPSEQAEKYARTFISQEFAGLLQGDKELACPDILELHLKIFLANVLHEIRGLNASERIAKVQSDLFQIREDLREDLRDTLDDAKDARFVRLAAEIGALAEEFLPENDGEDVIPATGDFEDLRRDYGRTV